MRKVLSHPMVAKSRIAQVAAATVIEFRMCFEHRADEIWGSNTPIHTPTSFPAWPHA